MANKSEIAKLFKVAFAKMNKIVLYVAAIKQSIATQARVETGSASLTWIVARVHDKRKDGEYLTLTISRTNALRKVHAINHQVLSFCVNTFRVIKDLMIVVNSFVVLCI